MKLLDTNELISLFREKSDFTDYNVPDAISRISYIEFLSWSSLSEDHAAFIKYILVDKFKIIDIDEEIADVASSLRRKHKISLGDSIVLATALEKELQLVTSDLRLKHKYATIKS